MPPSEIGRRRGIWTPDILLPKQAFYQAELVSDSENVWAGWIRTTNAKDEQLRTEKELPFWQLAKTHGHSVFQPACYRQWLPDYEAGAFANSATAQIEITYWNSFSFRVSSLVLSSCLLYLALPSWSIPKFHCRYKLYLHKFYEKPLLCHLQLSSPICFSLVYIPFYL